MPSILYEKNKTAILKWRAAHKQQYNEGCRARQARFYQWKKAQRSFLNILLPDPVCEEDQIDETVEL